MKNQNDLSFILPKGLIITGTALTENDLVIQIQSNQQAKKCPRCSTISNHFHSSYKRRVQDIPISLFKVEFWIKVRRYRCYNQACSQQTFAEQYGTLVDRRKRRTQRLLKNLEQIGLALGGQAGARLADKLTMMASPATLLRLIHKMEAPTVEAPRVIGIDDWAIRKGRSYGTIIIDHEKGKPIDVLPDRDSETVKAWLQQHPTIEIVTRDRSGEYREAINQALPKAVQIADRWHLLKNLREAVERHLSNHSATLRQRVTTAIVDEGETIKVKASQAHRRYSPGPTREALQANRAKEREALFAKVKYYHERGVYTSEIAKAVNLSRQTVSRWIRYETLPPDTRGGFKKKCLIDEYVPYLRQRIEAGCTNKSLLWREIADQGFTGTSSLVGKWIRQHYEFLGQRIDKVTNQKSKVLIPSVKELSWLLIRADDQLETDELSLLALLLQDEKLVELRQLVLLFIQIICDGLTEQWAPWLDRCMNSVVTELKNFAITLKKDATAIFEAIRQSWSNGPTEGHVNRLKFIKRSMYGRASFDLLRLRVLLVD